MANTSVSGVLGNKGGKLSLVHEGRVYPVSYLTQAKKAELECWMRQEAIRPVMALKPGRGRSSPLSPDEWRELWSDTLTAVAGGNFAWFSPATMAAIETPAGALALASILFEVPQELMQDLITAKPDEVNALLDLVIAESAPPVPDPAAVGEGPDPNVQAPA